jgi:triosephosphate isomerase
LELSLKPILCIGESKEQYESGQNREVCGNQLKRAFEDITPEQMILIAIACKYSL